VGKGHAAAGFRAVLAPDAPGVEGDCSPAPDIGAACFVAVFLLGFAFFRAGFFLAAFFFAGFNFPLAFFFAALFFFFFFAAFFAFLFLAMIASVKS